MRYKKLSTLDTLMVREGCTKIGSSLRITPYYPGRD